MSNFTVVRLTKVQPYLHTVGSSYAALANVDRFYAKALDTGVLDLHANTSGSHENLAAESMLVLIEGETSSYRSTSTIVLMVSAWTLLILGFVFCCCAECCGVSVWRGKKRCSVEGLNDAERGEGSDEDGAGGGGVSASTGGSEPYKEKQINRIKPMSVYSLYLSEVQEKKPIQ